MHVLIFGDWCDHPYIGFEVFLLQYYRIEEYSIIYTYMQFFIVLKVQRVMSGYGSWLIILPQVSTRTRLVIESHYAKYGLIQPRPQG